MALAKITSKGRITLPKEIRDRMGLKTGDEIEFVEVQGVVHMRKHLQGNPFEK